MTSTARAELHPQASSDDLLDAATLAAQRQTQGTVMFELIEDEAPALLDGSAHFAPLALVEHWDVTNEDVPVCELYWPLVVELGPHMLKGDL
ncbi:hypothetical protein [Cellulomonas alba]|uniref:Uncharacterized protein n=1 Tax=Cellulomonas alba TaxID=3053467 RepID=A0ABT7SH13_9CELL|nr:hypothetical protein [Cellulomonas alba]MDM7855489.1 hypothetical protein [Cellulomonas alba]